MQNPNLYIAPYAERLVVVYQFIDTLPPSEKYNLISQMAASRSLRATKSRRRTAPQAQPYRRTQ